MNPLLKGFIPVLILCLPVINACKKPVINDTGLISGESELNVLFTDTLTLQVATIREDSLRSDELNTQILGTMHDPTFGVTRASFYTQVLLPSNNVDLGQGLQFDSIVLWMEYKGLYGNPDVPQTIKVYEVTTDMYRDSVYYSNKRFSVSSAPIGRLQNFIPNTEDSVHLKEGVFKPHLRIRLDDLFGVYLLSQSGTANFADNNSFLQFFKGLYIVPDGNSGGEALMYFNMKSSLSKLSLYYSNADSSGLRFDFLITSDCAIVNHYEHDYTGTVIEQVLTSPVNNDSLVFVQSLAGLKAWIRIPYLSNLGEIAINKAELVILQAPDPNAGYDTVFPGPELMRLVAVDSSGKDAFLPDFFEGSSYFGGSREKIKNSRGVEVNGYRFNLALQLQQILTGKTSDYGLYLLTLPSNEIADRVVVGGGNHSTARMKLNLTYTKIE